MTKISQRNAQVYRKLAMQRKEVLDHLHNRWRSGWEPGYVTIGSVSIPAASYAAVSTARTLGHAVVAIPESDGIVRFYADRLPEVK